MVWGERGSLKLEIRKLRVELERLDQERESMKEQMDLQGAVILLKEEIVDLGIQESKIKEKHEKEERELRHMVGLEKKRQEVELKQGKEEAVLTIRQENLDADKKRFSEEMDFQRKRFEDEVGYLKDLMGQILERLPTVNVDKVVGRKK